MTVRGVRAAATVSANDAQEIHEVTLEMVNKLVTANEIDPADIASVWITVTDDLDAAFPAKPIRQLPQWQFVPIMCALEIPVKGSLQKCIRIMMHWNTTKTQQEIKHIYLGGAQALRPDLVQK